MTQYAYFVDLTTCAGCESCTVACQNKNGLSPDLAFTKVHRYEAGTFPDLTSSFITTQCMHCENPPCADVCPTGATYKEAAGPVQIDYEKCIGCKYCITACPYGARVEDEQDGVLKKCTMCFDRLSQGEQPACVQTCLTGARMVGDVANPEDPIHQAIGQPGVIRIEGTSFYYKVADGITRDVLPRNFQAAGITFAWQSIFQPVGQVLLGGTLAAVLVSLAATSVKSLKKGGEGHGGH